MPTTDNSEMDDKNTICIAAATNTGRLRKLNEDHFTVINNLQEPDWNLTTEPFTNTAKGSLLVIADGMGGTNCGEVASEIVIEVVKKYFEQLEDLDPADENIFNILKDAIITSHLAIIDHAGKHPETKGMGTTCIIGWLINEKLFVSWSGDSRCYHYRPGTGLKPISKDHSLVQSLLDEEKITKAQAFYHPQGNIITQCLGDPEKYPEPDGIMTDLITDDIILMCSDGLNLMLTDEEIETIIRANSEDVNSCKDVLVQKANDAGGMDNITVIIARILRSTNATVIADNDTKTEALNSTINKKPKLAIKKIAPFLIVIFIFLLLSAGLTPFFISLDISKKIIPVPANAEDSTKYDASAGKISNGKTEPKVYERFFTGFPDSINSFKASNSKKATDKVIQKESFDRAGIKQDSTAIK